MSIQCIIDNELAAGGPPKVSGGGKALPATAAKWASPLPPELNPWGAAEGLDTFLQSGADGIGFLDPEGRMLARAAVTEIFSPRGLGKSLYALWLAVSLARRGLRVMLIDRDNPRRIVRSRLKSFGAEPTTSGMKILSREKCPPLTNTVAWSLFPYSEFDVVILDSFDSATEGIGEQDSGRPSRALAPLLDIARRENGPAVLILGNCVKTAKHSRGSGVIEDRADIVYEVRDATGFHPNSSKWAEELPIAGAEGWAPRAVRRSQREKFRLAFVASKFRLSEEPEPFIIEIDLSTDPWTITDVTDDVDREGAEAREQRARERARRISEARNALEAEILRRASTGEPPLLKDRGISFLMAPPYSLKRADARALVDAPEGRWVLSRIEGAKGHPVELLPPGKNEMLGGNTPITQAAKILGADDAHFRRPHEKATAEIDPSQTRENQASQKPPISAETSDFYSGSLQMNIFEEGPNGDALPVENPVESSDAPIESPVEIFVENSPAGTPDFRDRETATLFPLDGEEGEL